ncbi:MAG: sulfatase-like hydrolase/transferase [Bryobacterales bacterium]|nr:sulfatase-like hydrolase/transferase [Bryobacterales bacterium]
MWVSLWRRRLAVISAVIVAPFAGFLVSHRYPAWQPEALAALSALGISAAVLAWVGRGSALYGIVLLSGCVVATEPLQRTLAPLVSAPRAAVAAALALFAVGLMVWLRERFFPLVIAFAAGAFAAHCGVTFARPALPTVRAAHAARPDAGHVLFLVLDEHCGPAGLPPQIPECRRAARAIEATFLSRGFRLYPNAFSNYASTVSSVPSLLNGRLLGRRGEFSNNELPDFYGVTHLETRPFFEVYRKRGYGILVLQDRRISFERSSAPAEVVDYASELASFAKARLPWTEKFAVLVGAYQASDGWLASWKGFFPGFRFGARPLAPLAVPEDWPAWLAERVAQAPGRSLFFAHLMVSHGPYLRRRDGTIRRWGEWRDDLRYEPVSWEQYRDRYARYAQQIEQVQSQLDDFFARLERAGLLEAITIVVVGDHGARIRLRRPDRYAGHADPERYDYLGTPPVEDLLDRFSVLLAIRRRGLPAGADLRQASALSILKEAIYGRPATEAETNSVFLFGSEGTPKAIPMVGIWRG